LVQANSVASLGGGRPSGKAICGARNFAAAPRREPIFKFDWPLGLPIQRGFTFGAFVLALINHEGSARNADGAVVGDGGDGGEFAAGANRVRHPARKPQLV
jgi:hypothetical protein